MDNRIELLNDKLDNSEISDIEIDCIRDDVTKIKEIKGEIIEILESLEAYSPNNELLKPLGVFEDGFRRHLYRQKWGLILLEYRFPIFMGILAILCLMWKLL